MKPIYLDYAATTPVDPEVFKKINDVLDPEGGNFGNPSSLHSFGQKAKTLLDFSRETLAQTIMADHREIIFTSSATEANNMVFRGVLKSFFKNQKDCGFAPKIIISSVEHPSVLETVRTLESEGAIKAVYLPVGPEGIIDLAVLEKNLDEKTVLVSIMWVNNETGALQPIEKILRLVSEFKKSKPRASNPGSYPLFHTDAVQAFNLFDLNVIKSGVDLMTLSSHKIYGPKGAGALYVKGGADSLDWMDSIITGGGQEYGLRSGTENIPAIIGFATAAKISHSFHKKELARLSHLSERFLLRLKKEIPGIEINGPIDAPERSPNILNLYFPRHKNLGVALDMMGIAASAGSACAQRYEKPSYVLVQMGFGPERIKQSIRFSFGRFMTEGEIDEAASRIIITLKK